MSTVKATFSGFVGFESQPVWVAEGQEYPSDHPLVLARPELFTEPAPEPVAEPKKQPTRGRPKAADE